MFAILIGLYGVAFCYALIMIDLKRRPAIPYDGGIEAGFRRYLLGAWFIASVFFGGRFFTIKLAGLFDMTIERAIFSLIVAGVAMDFLKGRWKGREDYLSESMLVILLGLCFFSMVRHGFRAVNPAFPNPWFLFISGYLFPAIVYIYVKTHFTRIEDVDFILWVFFGIGFYLAIIAYFEFFNLRQYVYPRYINDPTVWLHLDRARGPFLNAAVNGLMIVLGFIAGIYLSSRIKTRKWLMGAALTIMIPSVYFSQTRSVYLSFLLCLIGIGLFFKTDFPKWKTFALPIAIVIFMFLSVSPRLASSNRRAGGVMQIDEVLIRRVLIERSIAMITEEPILGHGFGQFIRVAAERYKGRYPVPGTAEEAQQHNHILGLWAELGIAGVTAYIIIVSRGVLRGFRSILFAPPDRKHIRNLSVALTMGMIAYLVNNMFIEPGFFLPYNSAFFIFLALVENLHASLTGKPEARLTIAVGR